MYIWYIHSQKRISESLRVRDAQGLRICSPMTGDVLFSFCFVIFSAVTPARCVLFVFRVGTFFLSFFLSICPLLESRHACVVATNFGYDIR